MSSEEIETVEPEKEETVEPEEGTESEEVLPEEIII